MRAGSGEKIILPLQLPSPTSYLTWYAFKEHGNSPARLYDRWNGKKLTVGSDYEYLVIEPYGFCILKVIA